MTCEYKRLFFSPTSPQSFSLRHRHKREITNLNAFLKKNIISVSSSVKKEKMSQNLLQWTVADVASYFSAAGFPEQAVAFRTQVSAPPQTHTATCTLRTKLTVYFIFGGSSYICVALFNDYTGSDLYN